MYYKSQCDSVFFGVKIKIILNILNRSPSIVRTNTHFSNGTDTTSRDEILLLKSQRSELSLSSKSALFSDAYFQTAFSGFFISNIVNPVVAFSFGLSNYFNAANLGNVLSNIPFDIINIDTHNGWSRASSVYNVPVAGVYVISLTSAAFAHERLFVALYVNNNAVAGLYFGSNNNNGIETLSRTVLINLNEGDQLDATLDKRFGGAAYSDIHCQTSMKGFLYNPHFHLPISWFVALETKLKVFTPVDHKTLLNLTLS